MFLAGSPTATCRSRWPRAPRRSRRSGGCSTSASPGRGASCGCPGRGPAPRARGPAGGRRRFLDGAASILGEGARSAAQGRPARSGRAGARGKPLKPALAVHCRTCGTELTTAAQRKTGRCDTCPPTYDEATFERLRAWRLAVARESSVPAYVVFTDATLMAIAEREPTSEGELAQISGVGARKLGLYGEQVLALIGGRRRRIRPRKSFCCNGIRRLGKRSPIRDGKCH